jgi:hypothetical protein
LEEVRLVVGEAPEVKAVDGRIHDRLIRWQQHAIAALIDKLHIAGDVCRLPLFT